MAPSDDVELDPEEFYKTNSMSLVTYLKMCGHTPQSIRWEKDSCFWYFDKSGHLLDSVDNFLNDEALVEPREYNRVFGLTKKELFPPEPQSAVS